MQKLHTLEDEDLRGRAPESIAALAQQMLQRLRQQDSEIKFKDQDRKDHLPARTAEGLEARREDRGDECQAEAPFR